MRFLVDTQLPKQLAQRLREAGHEAEHVLDLNLAQSPDNDLWQYAIRQGQAILTKDEDFAQWVMTGRSGPVVIWLRVGNCKNSELIASLLPALPQIEAALNAGDRLIEIF